MMAFKKWVFRILRVVGVAALAVVLLTFAAVQFQQRLLRWRCERLMADMHQIRLYQSTWADAQRLMHRWGAWGHYDGGCTAAECHYRVVLTDPSYLNFGWLNWIFQHGGWRIYSFFGGRSARLIVSFTMQDGTIWRETAGIAVTATKFWDRADEFPLTLIIQTKSRQRLRRTRDDWWVMGTDDQLAKHPYYKAGRPGGCKINCEEAVVTYSTRAPATEIERLTSFTLSCLTRLVSCTELDQLLPAANEWRLYHTDEFNAMQLNIQKPCDIPIWALARDAHYVLAVEGLSARIEREPGFAFNKTTQAYENGADFKKQEAHIKVLAFLKGDPPWPPETIVTAFPYSGTVDSPAGLGNAEHLAPAKRYILFPIGDDGRDQLLTRESPIELDRCGVREDTPENRRELEKGFAQNDTLRGPERW